MAMLLQEPSDEHVLPRTLGQAIVLQLRYMLRTWPHEAAAFLAHCVGKKANNPVGNLANVVGTLHGRSLLTTSITGHSPLDEIQKGLDPEWLKVIQTCTHGEGLDLAIRDWPGETSVTV
jgi:hypothetical protein